MARESVARTTSCSIPKQQGQESAIRMLKSDRTFANDGDEGGDGDNDDGSLDREDGEDDVIDVLQD